MTRSELIERLALRYPKMMAKYVEASVKTVNQAMVQALNEGKRIEIRGFGSFALSYRRSRFGRNPKSGERVRVQAKYLPHFKAGKDLRERVRIPVVDAAARKWGD